MLLLLLLLLLLHHDASLQPTRGGPPPMDEQVVSATSYLVCGERVCVVNLQAYVALWKGTLTSQGHNSGV